MIYLMILDFQVAQALGKIKTKFSTQKIASTVVCLVPTKRGVDCYKNNAIEKNWKNVLQLEIK